jgi:hypothetical protein
MFVPSKESLSSTQTIIARLKQLSDLLLMLIRLMENMERKKVEVPMPSWIMSKIVESTQNLAQIGYLCRTAYDKAAALQVKQKKRTKIGEVEAVPSTSADALQIGHPSPESETE